MQGPEWSAAPALLAPVPEAFQRMFLLCAAGQWQVVTRRVGGRLVCIGAARDPAMLRQGGLSLDISGTGALGSFGLPLSPREPRANRT